MQDMNLLVALDALLETRSVTAAAERLHVSPPAMSRTLGRARRALDDPILVRAGRQLVPTPKAIALQARIRAVVAEAGDLLRAGDTGAASERRTFTIRGPEDIPALIGRHLLAGVATTFPTVTVRFVPEGDEDVDDLRSGRIDLDVGVQHGHFPDVVIDPVFTDEVIGIVDARHPLAQQRVTLRRFAAHPHISVTRKGRIRGAVDDALAGHGLTRTVAATVPSSSSAIALLPGSPLVALLPSLVLRVVDRPHRFASFRPPIPVPSLDVALAWHRRLDADPTHAAMRQLVHEALDHAAHAGAPVARLPATAGR